MMKYENIAQNLIETIADWLDSESVVFEQDCNKISEGVSRENSDLHIRMADAAMEIYKQSTSNPSTIDKNQTTLFEL